MAFQLSPGVSVSETDLTTYIPSTATSIGGFSGEFAWGPANEIVSISNENELLTRFGKPTNNTATSWFTVSNFLAYSNNVKVIRTVDETTANNAVANGTPGLISNEDEYANNSLLTVDDTFAAKYPGELGNSIRIEVADSSTPNTWSGLAFFQGLPATSDYVSDRGGANDEIHIIVYDSTGKISGRANTVLERFGYVSKAYDAKNFDGTSNYYKDIINNKSKYIWWLGHPVGANTDWGYESNTNFKFISQLTDDVNGVDTANNVIVSQLAGGTDGSAIAAADFSLFSNEAVDVSLIMTGAASAAAVISAIGIAESRKDCIVFCSPLQTDVVNNYGSETQDIIDTRDSYISSSYAFMDSNWKYQYDKYNDAYRWIPLNGDIAGLCARADRSNDPWYSPAGLQRGIIKNVIKLAWNPDVTARDAMYIKGINPVVTFSGEGTVLYGDRTLLSRPSAFDRINVRRLFITLEKTIAKAARSSLFEFNDQFTRAQFVALVEPFLREVHGRRGITDFRVICDETNNTQEIIDTNQFVGDIYLKPTRSINFIQLNFVAVRSGVAFNEIVGIV